MFSRESDAGALVASGHQGSMAVICRIALFCRTAEIGWTAVIG